MSKAAAPIVARQFINPIADIVLRHLLRNVRLRTS